MAILTAGGRPGRAHGRAGGVPGRTPEDSPDDLTTALIQANVDGESLTHVELSSFFILLLVAGNETTRTAINHGLVGPDRAPRPARCLAEGHRVGDPDRGR